MERPPAVVESADRGGADSGLDDSQQQADTGRAVQQARLALLAAFAVQADASPTIDSIPTIAARATQGSRR
jgi:hypothetical protein